MAERMGELLIRRNILTAAQVETVLAHQKSTGRPFGQLASELFGVPEAELWRAWATQMIGCYQKVDLSTLKSSPAALAVYTAREAWGFRILPLEKTAEGISLATSAANLPTAMAVAQIRSDVPVEFVLAEPTQLEAAIRERYNITAQQIAA